MKEDLKFQCFVQFDFDGEELRGSEYYRAERKDVAPVSIVFAKHLLKREDIVPTLRKIADAFEATMPEAAP